MITETKMPEMVWVRAAGGTPGHWAFKDKKRDLEVDRQNEREALAVK